MLRRSLFFLFMLSISTLFAQEDILNQYVQQGLANNLALQQKTFCLKKSMAGLNEARGMFLPSISLEARYSRAGGGRLIEIPVGDLMNPVYSTLNQLLESIGQPPAFPESISNEYVPFLREEEHETKIRVVQPIFQPAMIYNVKIKKALRDIEELSRNQYARQLVFDIQSAYFEYLKTCEIVALLQETEKLVRENVRVSESLYANQKVTQAVVFRAQAEYQSLKQEQARAEKGRVMTASYFNFLLNAPLDGPIEAIARPQVRKHLFMNIEEAKTLAVERREEIRQLDIAVALTGSKVNLSKTAFLPGISAVVDWGYQGETYRFTEEDDYWMASLVAQWNFFNGFQDKYKVAQAKYEQSEIKSRLEMAESQIRLQVQDARQGLIVSEKTIEAVEKRMKSAKKSYQIIDRKFKEGMASQIEYIDARNTMTRAEVDYLVSIYDWYIRQAEWEKVLALYPLPENQ